MTKKELLRRLKVGRKPLLALLRPAADVDGWHVFVELMSEREVEVRFQASANEEGGVSFFGTYQDVGAMIGALESHYGSVESWDIREPEWEPPPDTLFEVMRARIGEDTLPLPDGVARELQDGYWSTFQGDPSPRS